MVQAAFNSIISGFAKLGSLRLLLTLLIIINIAFFAVSIVRPGYNLFGEFRTFEGSATQLMSAVGDIEANSGVPMEQFSSAAIQAYGTLLQSTNQAQRDSAAVRTALVNPRTIVALRDWDDEDFDCLGAIESIFRSSEAIYIESASGVRWASFEGPLGFTHVFAATCTNDSVSLFGTGYNFAATRELHESLLNDLAEVFPEDEDVAVEDDSPAEETIVEPVVTMD